MYQKAFLLIIGKSKNGETKVIIKYKEDLNTLSLDSSLLFDIIACGTTKPPISVIPLFKRQYLQQHQMPLYF